MMNIIFGNSLEKNIFELLRHLYSLAVSLLYVYLSPSSMVNVILLAIIDKQCVNLKETKAITQLESCGLREYR